MMKSILISIKPEYCELIAKGEKTIEVRKTKPKIAPPFKVYIYCTKNGLKIYSNENCYITDSLNILNSEAAKGFEKTSHFSKWNGKVIGEFVCDEINLITQVGNMMSNKADYRAVSADGTLLPDNIFDFARLTKKEVAKYLDGGNGYTWHISDIVIYDKPKELSEFYVVDKEAIRKCKNREQSYYAFTDTGYIKNGFLCTANDDWCFGGCKKKTLIRPPQSWCYVKEREFNA